MNRWLQHFGYVCMIAFGGFITWKLGPLSAIGPTMLGIGMVWVFLSGAWENGI